MLGNFLVERFREIIFKYVYWMIYYSDLNCMYTCNGSILLINYILKIN